MHRSLVFVALLVAVATASNAAVAVADGLHGEVQARLGQRLRGERQPVCFTAVMNASHSNTAATANHDPLVQSTEVGRINIQYFPARKENKFAAQLVRQSIDQNGMNVNGIHIHIGGPDTEGPPVVFFCGNENLPAALRAPQIPNLPACSQDRKSAYQHGQFSNNADKSVTEEQVEALLTGSNPHAELYANLHTDYSFDTTKGNGLVRGQLISIPCAPTQ